VLEFAPNDGSLLINGATTSEMVSTTIADAVRRVLAAGCLPALLILPIQSLLVTGDIDIIRNIYLDIAKKYHLPFFDGYGYVQRIVARGTALEKLFQDDMHLTREVAVQLGTRFLEGLLDLNGKRRPGSEIAGSGFTYHYITIEEMDVGGIPLMYRATQLYSASTIDLKKPGTYCIKSLPLGRNNGRWGELGQFCRYSHHLIRNVSAVQPE
jgi:hypothetical protein